MASDRIHGKNSLRTVETRQFTAVTLGWIAANICDARFVTAIRHVRALELILSASCAGCVMLLTLVVTHDSGP